MDQAQPLCVCGTSALQGVDQVRLYRAYFSISHRSAIKLVCYSDSCFGQNKIFAMICFWNSLIQFKQIDHKYLVRGHTYLPNDRDFSHIEKLKSSAHVFIPEQWEYVIASARKKDPYNVQRMIADKF